MKNLIVILILFSITSFGQFTRNQTIVAGEYFINTDPGEGKGINLPGTYNLANVDINLSNINVPIGSTIYVRFKSSNNKWSSPRGIKRKAYFSNSQASLVKAEYFINNDPGLGNATQVILGSGGIINLFDMSLKQGDKIYFRVKDSNGRWSPNNIFKFKFPALTRAEYKIKLSTGDTTSVRAMTMDLTTDSSFLYSAHQNNISWQANDSIFVRFQSADKFYSKWVRGPLDSTYFFRYLTLTALIQGFLYGSTMIPDTVTLELHKGSSPYNLIEAQKGILNSAGVGSYKFLTASLGTPYFLVVKHRNAVETWSSTGKTFSISVLSYNFTSAKSQAYGNNLVLKNGMYCLYSGDVNHDGLVDSGDLAAIDNDNSIYITGYTNTDVNGDGIIDTSDLALTDNNNSLYVGKIVPAGAPAESKVNRPVKTIKQDNIH